MKRKRRFLLAGIGICVAVACMVIVLIQYRLRGSVEVVPDAEISGAEVVFYRQKDDRWADDQLGNSSYTMSSSGCLFSCIAAAMEMSDIDMGEVDDNRAGRLKTPGELNDYFTENHVYDAQGNLQWEQLGELDDFEVEVSDSVSAELIGEYLQSGRYPIVRVRMNGYGSYHYVLVVSAVDGKFYCMDPMKTDQEPVPLSEYDNRVYAVRCVYPGDQRVLLELEDVVFYEKTVHDEAYITAVRRSENSKAAWSESVPYKSKVIDVEVPSEGVIAVTYQSTDREYVYKKEYDWQGTVEGSRMPEEPSYIPDDLLLIAEEMILKGEEYSDRYLSQSKFVFSESEEELLNVSHQLIGMFEDFDEYTARSSLYQVDFDNDGYRDIVVHLREGNGRMAMYTWYFLQNEGNGQYKVTEEQSSYLSSGRFIEYKGKNYLIEVQDDIITNAARIFTGLSISYCSDGKIIERVFLSFGAQDKIEEVYDEKGNLIEIKECPVAGRGPVKRDIYTRYVNTLFRNYS